MFIVLTYFWLGWVLLHIWLSFTIHYFRFHFKCCSILHFAVCQLLCWAFMLHIPTIRFQEMSKYICGLSCLILQVIFMNISRMDGSMSLPTPLRWRDGRTDKGTDKETDGRRDGQRDEGTKKGTDEETDEDGWRDGRGDVYNLLYKNVFSIKTSSTHSHRLVTQSWRKS